MLAQRQRLHPWPRWMWQRQHGCGRVAQCMPDAAAAAAAATAAVSLMLLLLLLLLVYLLLLVLQVWSGQRAAGGGRASL